MEDFGGLQLNSYQKFSDGLYVFCSDNETGETRYVLLPWTSEALMEMPKGLIYLGGCYYTVGGDGNMARIGESAMYWNR